MVLAMTLHELAARFVVARTLYWTCGIVVNATTASVLVLVIDVINGSAPSIPIVKPCQPSAIGTVELIELQMPRKRMVPWPSLPHKILPGRETSVPGAPQ